MHQIRNISILTFVYTFFSEENGLVEPEIKFSCFLAPTKMEIYKQTTEISTKMTHSTLKSSRLMMTPTIHFMDSEGLNSSMNAVDPAKDA